MNKIKIKLYILVIFLIPKSLLAIEYSHLKIGGSFYNYQYEEPNIMNLKGTMKGIDGAIEFRTSPINTNIKSESLADNGEDFFIAGELSYSKGKVDYNSQSTGSIKNENNKTLETRILGGVNLFNPNISPYAGIGYRKLVNDAANMVSSTGHIGYKRTSQYLYIPAGIRANLVNSKNLQIKLTAEYDFLIKGQQTSDLTIFPEYNYKSKSSQNSGFGARLSLDLGLKINNKTPLIISPFINYWNIEDSEPDQKNQFYEPKNNTVESGVKIYLLI